LKARISDLEQTLENVKQTLADTESLLADRNDEIYALRANIRELEELREFKAVLYQYYLSNSSS
jgi:uncharacterized protein involved in exopolysaccharide biosynthesis